MRLKLPVDSSRYRQLEVGWSADNAKSGTDATRKDIDGF
jgi:hypothetical protein